MKDILRHYMEVLLHKWFVLRYGLKVGGIPLWRLIIHDWSKFLPLEYRAYIKRHVHGNCSPEEWKVAWFHHVRHNPHHWEYWLLKAEPQPMPERFVRELVADYMAAGEYSGSDDLQTWLNTKSHKMILHPETERILERVLTEQGFVWPSSGN